MEIFTYFEWHFGSCVSKHWIVARDKVITNKCENILKMIFFFNLTEKLNATTAHIINFLDYIKIVWRQ